MKKNHTTISKIFLSSLLIGLSVLSAGAFTGPSSVAPLGNPNRPLNVGPQYQETEDILVTEILGVYGEALIDNGVLVEGGSGTVTAPDRELFVQGEMRVDSLAHGEAGVKRPVCADVNGELYLGEILLIDSTNPLSGEYISCSS